MAKLSTFVLIPIVVLIVAAFSAILFGRDQRAAMYSVLSLAACGLCAMAALLMQLATGSTLGLSWWFIAPGLFFVLALTLFAVKRSSPGIPRLIYALTFLSAISTGIGVGFVVEADLKAHRDANYLR